MHLVIFLDGGLVERVLVSQNPVGLRVLVVDCDTEGAYEDDLTPITMYDGKEAKVFLSEEELIHDAATVDGIFKAFDKKDYI